MKGIILAGGSGSRLSPLTISVNKHLLPVGNKPMITHCVEKMVQSGITDILIVTNPEYVGNFSMLLKSGIEFGCNITYKTQDKPDGVAGALAMAKEFVGSDSCAVILGDNMFNFDIATQVKNFKSGCHLLFKFVPDGHRYGIGRFKDGKLYRLDEKPKDVETAFACIGVYLFDKNVFSIISTISPSARGEYEISDVINAYLTQNKVTFDYVDGWWTDAGTLPSYQKANEMMWNEKI
jgi:glucose-1-phosphate thymidylyltransferase